MEQRKPTQEFRIGLVKAAIWEAKNGHGSFYTVSLNRLYKEGDKWKRSNSFSNRELGTLVEVIGQAKSWIEAQETGK